MDFKETHVRMDWNHMEGSCKHGIEFLGSTKGEEFGEYLNNCWLLKKDSLYWSYFFVKYFFLWHSAHEAKGSLKPCEEIWPTFYPRSMP
jgi:hypothetical protein